MTDYESPLLSWPGAVPAEGPDAGVAWHYGDPLREQRTATTGAGLIDGSHRDVVIVDGPDRLDWLHAICSQHVSNLRSGDQTEALVLSPNGHVEQHWVMSELADRIWIDTEPGAGAEVLAYLLKMRFLKRVEPQLVTAEWAVLSLEGPGSAAVLALAGLPAPLIGAEPVVAGTGDEPAGFVRRRSESRFDLVVPRTEFGRYARQLREAGAAPIGSWAAAALRVERREPRLGWETDHRTIPQEVNWIGSAVHLDKGCYRGQETVARVQNLGRPPRRLVLLHLAGESDELPAVGEPVLRADRAVGFIGTAVHHHELGPIALAVLKRSIGSDEQLTVGAHLAVVDAVSDDPVSGFAGTVGAARTTAG